MATVIDEFIVEIGLDPAKFHEGRRQLDQTIGEAKAGLQQFGDTVEHSGTKIGEAFSFAKRGAAGLIAMFVGGEAAAFIEKIANMDAATMRLARSIGMTTAGLSAWQNLAGTVGVSPEAINSSFANINDTMMNFRMGLGRPNPGLANLMGTAGISLQDNPDQFMEKVLHSLVGLSPQMQRFRLQQAPIDQSTIPFFMELLRTPERMAHLSEELKRIGQASEESARQSVEFQAEAGKLEAALRQLGRVAFPVLTAAATGLAAIIEKLTSLAGVRELLFGKEGDPGDNAFSKAERSAFDFATGGKEYRDSVQSPRQGTRGDRNNNPGNMEYGPFAKAHGAVGTDGRFAVFPDWDTGANAMGALIAQNYQGLSLAGIQRKWVGNADPNYLKRMEDETGLGAGDVPNLKDQKVFMNLIRGMMRGEGTHIGGKPAGKKEGGSPVSIGTINVHSSNADPKKVADAIPAAMRRYTQLGSINTGLG